MTMLERLRYLFWYIVAWFRPEQATQATPPEAHAPPLANIYAAGLVPPPEPIPSATTPRFINRPGKFVKPKGEKPVKLKRERDPLAEKKPRKPRVKLPDQRPLEDPEQWGQYYFRNAILDQLEYYFIYLKRMRKGDRAAYDLHRQVGIQLLPSTALQSFDTWRTEGQIDELSAWFKQHRPSFGAIAYSAEGVLKEEMTTVDAPPEFFKKHGEHDIDATKRLNAIGAVTRGVRMVEVAKGIKEREGLLWVPKFLYFFKYDRLPPKHVECVKNADIYMMTVYWDRTKQVTRGWQKRHPGGIPQEYALCIDRDTNAIRILRQEVCQTLRIRSRRAASGAIYIPQKFWTSAADSQLSWAFGRYEASPENYLIRCFIEAALMFESSVMGSMVRVEARKGDLAATFGVDIKRMSYFFKDRDYVVTSKGRRPRIFHIVRPHIRTTKSGEEIGVKLSFRGVRNFDWAGYKISISVPTLDHINWAELKAAAQRYGGDEKIPKGRVGTKELGAKIVRSIKEGRGRWQASAN